MTGEKAYLLVVAPLVVLIFAAVWRPRVWQLLTILAGPTISALAIAGAPLLDYLGWLATLGVPYAFLVVPPVLPWRRRWPRWAVPSTVLLICGVLILAAEGAVAMIYILGPPALLSVGALLVSVIDQWLWKKNAPPTPALSAAAPSPTLDVQS